MKRVSIEYAHIYTNQQYSEQHDRSIEELQAVEARTDADEIIRTVLIDDYSPGMDYGFDIDGFVRTLSEKGAAPDVVALESALVPYCRQTLDAMSEGKEKRNLLKYIEANGGKYPCSLFVASWYLLRLGAYDLGDMELVRGDKSQIVADELVTVLPQSFVTPEKKAGEIIKRTKHKAMGAHVLNHFFNYEERQYSPWTMFDSQEYAERNYGEVLPEDAQIIEFVQSQLESMNPDPLYLTADIGAGPNLYPSLLLNPHMHKQGVQMLLEYVPNNVTFLNDALRQTASGKKGMWDKFEDIIEGSDLSDLSRRAHVKRAAIADLPDHAFDAATSFFVADSITDKREEFIQLQNKVMKSIKPGGLFVMAHMLGSKGYFAGEREWYPAVDLDARFLSQFYGNWGVSTALVTAHGEEAPREGYSGMIVVIGRRHENL